MTASELGEHAGYVADEVKMRAYRQAMRHACLRGARTMLDLGSGSGVLGLIGVSEGAERVYAVDSGAIVGPASEVARASGVGDAIVQFRGQSTEIELPELVDVVVCDQIGGFVHDAGVLGYFADARSRHLIPGGRLIPAGFRLFLAAASCPRVRDQVTLWRSHPEGIDFSHFAELAVNTEHRIQPEECELLSPGISVAEISADHDQAFHGSGSARVDNGGPCDGVVGWFEADLGGGVTLTNHPGDTGRMKRWCNFYPLTDAVELEHGDQISVHVDVRPLLHAVTWRVVVADSAGVTKCNERHSTLLGQFMSPDDLRRSSGARVRTTGLGRAVARALTLANGTVSVDEILAIIGQELRDDPAVSQQEDAIRDLVRRLTVPALDRTDS